MTVTLADMLTDPLMQRALIAALLVGLSTPVVGTFLVQRRLALLGDGIGHVALTGVAAGTLAGSVFSLVPQDVLAIPGAIIASVAGAILIEMLSSRGKLNGDVALALLFYGGIAGGVLLMGLAHASASLNSYLFGSITSVSFQDVWVSVGLAAVILIVGFGLRSALFAVCHDEEFARASGLPVRALNILLAVIAALTVTVSMRVVGLLLVSAIMIVPVAIAQQLTSSFKGTMRIAMCIGVLVCVVGLSITYFVDIPSGATIVLLAIALYAIVALARPLIRRRRTDHAESAPSADDVEVPAT